MNNEELRAIQAPIKERYKEQPDAAQITLKAEGRLQSEEVVLRTKTGATVLALISAELIELGGRTYVLTNVLDITERKKALAALQESEQRFRRLVQDMSIGVALRYRS